MDFLQKWKCSYDVRELLGNMHETKNGRKTDRLLLLYGKILSHKTGTGQRSNRSVMDVGTAYVCQEIDLRGDTDPFCAPCHLSTTNKKDISRTSLKSKKPFKWVVMETIRTTYSNSLTKDTTFDTHLLIVDAYSNIPKRFGMEYITTEEVMEKLDIFQAIFEKVDEFGWCDTERI